MFPVTVVSFCLSALIPTAFAAALTPPKYFILQAQTVSGYSKEFNGQYVESAATGQKQSTPLFYPKSDGSSFFQLKEPADTTNRTYYTLASTPSYGPAQYATLAESNDYASWQPVYLDSPGSNGPTKTQTGFYLTGSQDQMYLEYTSKPSKPVDNYFKGWLVCDWWFDAPQLFFITEYGKLNPSNFPSTCAMANLLVIPLNG